MDEGLARSDSGEAGSNKLGCAAWNDARTLERLTLLSTDADLGRVLKRRSHAFAESMDVGGIETGRVEVFGALSLDKVCASGTLSEAEDVEVEDDDDLLDSEEVIDAAGGARERDDGDFCLVITMTGVDVDPSSLTALVFGDEGCEAHPSLALKPRREGLDAVRGEPLGESMPIKLENFVTELRRIALLSRFVEDKTGKGGGGDSALSRPVSHDSVVGTEGRI